MRVDSVIIRCLLGLQAHDERIELREDVDAIDGVVVLRSCLCPEAFDGKCDVPLVPVVALVEVIEEQLIQKQDRRRIEDVVER